MQCNKWLAKYEDLERERESEIVKVSLCGACLSWPIHNYIRIWILFPAFLFIRYIRLIVFAGWLVDWWMGVVFKQCGACDDPDPSHIYRQSRALVLGIYIDTKFKVPRNYNKIVLNSSRSRRKKNDCFICWICAREPTLRRAQCWYEVCIRVFICQCTIQCKWLRIVGLSFCTLPSVWPAWLLLQSGYTR